MFKRMAALVMACALLMAGSIGSPARAAATVNLTLMGWSSSPSENTRLQSIVDTWNKNNADIQVKLAQVPDFDTTLAKSLAGGEPADVFYVDSSRFPDLVEAGALAPIGDKLTNPDDFYPALSAAFTSNGKLYCAPKDFSTLALFINSDMMAAAGIKDAPKTWDEMAAAAKAMTKGDVPGIVIANDTARWIAFLYQAGGSFADDKFEKMTITSPEAVAATTFFTSFIANGTGKTFKQLSADWVGDAFLKGKAAMAVEGNWLVPAIKDNAPKLNYKIVELPAGPKGKATMAFTVCYGVAAKGKNIDAATKFADYLTGAEGMKAWTDLGLAMPTRKSLRDGWLKTFPELKAFLDGADYARKWQFVPGFNKTIDEMGKQLGEIFNGNVTVDEALKAVDKVGVDALASRTKK